MAKIAFLLKQAENSLFNGHKIVCFFYEALVGGGGIRQWGWLIGKYTQIMDGKSGYVSQSDAPLYFGLGNASVESITVKWPAGGETVVPGSSIADLRLVTIVEAD